MEDGAFSRGPMVAITVLRIVIGPFVYFMAAMIALSGLVHLYKVFAPWQKR